MTVAECGAACLAMILNYFGRPTRLAECRHQCRGGRRGVTALGIVMAAKRYGLQVQAFRAPGSAIEGLKLPAIVHWRRNHFVVLEECSTEGATIVDPAIGRRTLTAAEFAESYSGIVLCFEPGSPVEHGTCQVLTWREYLRDLWAQEGVRAIASRLLIASLLLQLSGLAAPLLTKLLIDGAVGSSGALSQGPIAGLAMVGIGMLALVLTQASFLYIRSLLLIRLRTQLDSRMMPAFFQRLLSLPYPYFQQRSTGDLVTRLESSTAIRATVSNQTLGAVLDLCFVLVYLVLLVLLDAPFAAFVIGIGLLQVFLLLATANATRTMTDRELDAHSVWRNFQLEILAGIATVKAAGAESRTLTQWRGLLDQHLTAAAARGRQSAAIDTAMITLRTAAPLLLLWLGANRVADGTMGLGSMLALNAMAASFLGPLGSIISSAKQFHQAGTHLEQIADVLEAQPEQKAGMCRAAPEAGRIEMERVSFRYDSDSPPVLTQISLAVAPGQKVAVVGPTGSGKSTLGMLLLGLYRPESGVIRYDGIPLEQFDYTRLRSRFGVVLQECHLFSGSIHEYLSGHDPAISREAVVEAAKLACIHTEIQAMPMGYESQITGLEDGMSGGQRQRLALARALAHRPAILLLDEATSHLDVMTERAVSENLSRISATRIVIAHRLSTIADADQILVLDRGTIVERGRHEELLQFGMLYPRLVSDQQCEEVCI